MTTSYAQKLKDPRWQKLRLQVLERDQWVCRACFEEGKTLHVHHGYYEKGKEPWDYPLESLYAVCEDCHASVDAMRTDMQFFFAMLPYEAQVCVHTFMQEIPQMPFADMMPLVMGIQAIVEDQRRARARKGYEKRFQIPSIEEVSELYRHSEPQDQHGDATP